MLLTKNTPNNWRDLQNITGEVLRECGFDVTVESTKSTVRGSVEIDVYAEETIEGRKHTVACECKYWKSAVPQSVIHAFRTVMGDLGLNQGYIISMVGFQSGAYKAAENSNIKLMTWDEWQAEFCQTWIKNHLFPSVTKHLDKLIEFTEPLVPNWFCDVQESDVAVLKKLRYDHTVLGALAMSLSVYSNFMGRRSSTTLLPLRSTVSRMSSEYALPPDCILDALGYRDLYTLLLSHGNSAIQEFEAVRQRNNLA